MPDFDFTTVTTMVNYLFVAAIAWVRSIEMRLRNITPHTNILIKNSEENILHRLEKLEDRVDKLHGQHNSSVL